MNNKEIYLKRHILNIKNLVLFIILSLISAALMLSFSLVIKFNELRNTIQKYNIGFRTIIVYSSEDNYDYINNIKHIVAVEDSLYKGSIPALIGEFDNSQSTSIMLKALIDEKGLDIVYGNKLINTGDAVCSDKFYPYDMELSNNSFIFRNDKIIKPKDAINKKFSAVSENDSTVIKEFTIVGFYNSRTTENNLNTCYILKDDYKQLASPYESMVINEYPDGTRTEEKNEYKGKMVIVDNINNVEEVIKELSNNGYQYYMYSELNNDFLNLILNVPIFIAIIIILVMIALVSSFFSKKIKDRNKESALLKVLGYTFDDIKKINLIENMIIAILSIAFGTFMYIVVFEILKSKYLIDYIYQGININFSWISIILTFILVLLLVIILNNRKIHKLLVKSINNIIGSI